MHGTSAKQSQFAAGRTPHHSIVPSFQSQFLAPAKPGPIMQNKPNHRRADSPHHSNISPFQHSGRMAIVQNKPRLPGAPGN
jgi:hypothetical protein